jgi:sn-glycerol 3-phosphate transport system permease protein
MSLATVKSSATKTDAPGGSSAPARVSAGRRRRILPTILGGYLPLVVIVLVVALPLGWMILSSFKQVSEVITLNLQVLPQRWSLVNYTEAFRTAPFGRFFLNSVLVTVVGATLKVLLAIHTAYALVFVRFPAKNVIFVAVLVALMVPPQVAILPNYVLIAGMNGLNTYWGIIVPSLGTAFGTFLLRQAFRSLPMSMLEAAEVDGAGHLARLWRMVIPVTAPSIATVALVTIVSEWNEYIWPLIITTDPNLMTLPVGLTLLQNNESGPAGYGVMMAGAVIVILPVLAVFAFLQRYIVAGLTAGTASN